MVANGLDGRMRRLPAFSQAELDEFERPPQPLPHTPLEHQPIESTAEPVTQDLGYALDLFSCALIRWWTALVSY